MPEALSVLAGFFGGLIGAISGPFIGGVVSEFFGRRTEDRAERRAQAAECIDAIDEVLLACREYWSNGSTVDSASLIDSEARIVAGLHHIQILINDLFYGRSTNLRNTKSEWKALHGIATGGDFGDPNISADARILQAVLQDGYTLRAGVKRRSRLLI